MSIEEFYCYRHMIIFRLWFPPWFLQNLLAQLSVSSVRELENSPYFNAGKGSVLTTNGTVEMEACIMDGNTKRCGAVSGVTTVVNPISLARRIMEKMPHIYLAFDGAGGLCKRTVQGLETVDKNHFITPENIERLKQAKESNRVQQDYTQPIITEDQKETPDPDGISKLGTVGCVAVDSLGNLAAATSTGGLVNKMVGRIGDTPIPGAGSSYNKKVKASAQVTTRSSCFYDAIYITFYYNTLFIVITFYYNTLFIVIYHFSSFIFMNEID